MSPDPDGPACSIDGRAVSLAEFEAFLETLTEVPHTWYCAETNTGGSTGYEGTDADGLMEAALEAGAEDVVEGEENIDVVVSPYDFSDVKTALEGAGFTVAHAEIAMEPSTLIKVAGSDAEQMLKLSDALEDLDDVQQVYANIDISDEEMAQLAEA